MHVPLYSVYALCLYTAKQSSLLPGQTGRVYVRIPVQLCVVNTGSYDVTTAVCINIYPRGLHIWYSMCKLAVFKFNSRTHTHTHIRNVNNIPTMYTYLPMTPQVLNPYTLFNVSLYIHAGGDLSYHLEKEGRFQVGRVRLYLAELALALEYLRSRCILHRDVKPANMLLDSQGHVHLTDFNVACVIKPNSHITSVTGTKPYMGQWKQLRTQLMVSKRNNHSLSLSLPLSSLPPFPHFSLQLPR